MQYKRNIYRYILNPIVDLNTPISAYKIVAQNKFPTEDDYPILYAVRFQVPTDMRIIPKKGTTYAKTEDNRTLAELNAHLVIKINGKWKESPQGLSLQTTQPHQVHQEMLRLGYFVSQFGYLDKDRYLYYNYEYPMWETTEDKSSILTFEKGYHTKKTSS